MWGQFSIGGLKADLNTSNPKGFFKGEMNLFGRFDNIQYSLGYVQGATEAWDINNYWSTIGYALYGESGELSANIGLSYSNFEYQFWEAERIITDYHPGVIFIAQSMIHIKDGYAGFGPEISIQYSEGVKYYSFSFFIAFGVWNF